MSELEFGGVKFKGGKLVGILVGLSTLIGASYGAFEVYKDYTNMKEIIHSYDASKLDIFEVQLDNMEKKFDGKISNIEKLLQSEISTAVELVTAAQGDARDIRNELRKDMNELLDQINSVDKRSRLTEQEIRTSQRTAENDVRTLIQHAEDRFDGKRTAIESDAQRRAEAMDVKLTELEERLRDMLQKALNNPLTGQ
jgi:intracellular sulfur oxidation DsrE/DsrF family protein